MERHGRGGGAALRDSLDHEPRELRFGTSGRRGLVIDLTQLEIYINARAELDYLLSLSLERGGIRCGDVFCYASDLRPSSYQFVAEQMGRGEIAQAIDQAIRDAGLQPEFLGFIPTPALTLHALENRRGGMMVTGSHIPFDRNGYKTNSSRGELLKEDEEPINRLVQDLRKHLYAAPFSDSPFDRSGRFKPGPRPLPAENGEARERYIRRYLDFFPRRCLAGRRIVVYQHSAVGRDILVEILAGLGATVLPMGCSDVFVPIDTENVDQTLLTIIRDLVEAAGAPGEVIDAVVSTDGDSDRPLVLGIDPETSDVRFFGGDLVGMIVADYLNAGAVVVPISCNDAIDRGPLRDRLEPKTRIGSPYVIAGMEKAMARGHKAVCGWEANGGFLLASDIERDGRILRALPTRDAVLPIVCVLAAAVDAGLSLVELFSRLPQRFSRAGLLRRISRDEAQERIHGFYPSDSRIREVRFEAGRISCLDGDRNTVQASKHEEARLEKASAALGSCFTSNLGFDRIRAIDYTDGVRVYFGNGEISHVRPSGNADELRIYAVADTQARADAIVAAGIAEPDGILRRILRTAMLPEDEARVV